MSQENKLKKEEEERIKKGYESSIEEVQEEDVNDAFNKGNKKFEKLEEDIPNPLLELWDDLKTLIALLGDFITKKYSDVPWNIIASVAAAVLYFVSPIDVIPDIIPIVGFLDDALVLKLCLNFARKDIEKYKEWKDKQED